MRYYIIAGEVSGDLHGSKIMESIKKFDNKAKFRFWGGEKMKEIDTITQNLQATYVSKLISITNLKKYDEVAQSAAFGELLKIQKLLRRQSSNDETRNHKNRLSLQIDKKLTA